MVVYLDVFQYSTSKGPRHNMLFLCPLLVPLPRVLLREVKVLCIKH